MPRLARIRTERVPPAIVQQIREQAGISIGDPMSEATAKRIIEIATSIDEHLQVRFERDANGGVILLLIAP